VRFDTLKHLKKHNERFFEHLAINDDVPDSCWLWTGTITANGYGVFCMDGERVVPHRVMWMLERDCWIPAGLYILHRCGNRACCNPAHLYPAKRAYRFGEKSQFVEVPEWDLKRFRTKATNLRAARQALRRAK
jgi:hypothetical protein